MTPWTHSIPWCTFLSCAPSSRLGNIYNGSLPNCCAALALALLGQVQADGRLATGTTIQPESLLWYDYVGQGCCADSEGNNYGFERLIGGYGYITLQKCGEGCIYSFSSDPAFVGINYHPDFNGEPVCNCMMNYNGNGQITGVNYAYGSCADKLCYRVAEVRRKPERHTNFMRYYTSKNLI